MSDRSADTLIPIIKRWVFPGTTVHSCLTQEGYIHETVNHSDRSVDSTTGAYTRNIESRWRTLKHSALSRYGTHHSFYESYFAEYVIRQKYLTESEDRFFTFLGLLKRGCTPAIRKPTCSKRKVDRLPLQPVDVHKQPAASCSLSPVPGSHGPELVSKVSKTDKDDQGNDRNSNLDLFE